MDPSRLRQSPWARQHPVGTTVSPVSGTELSEAVCDKQSQHARPPSPVHIIAPWNSSCTKPGRDIHYRCANSS